jgi:hypothetical protein
MYNPEPQSLTPYNENQNPVYYSTQFFNLAHEFELEVVQAPSLVYVIASDQNHGPTFRIFSTMKESTSKQASAPTPTPMQLVQSPIRSTRWTPTPLYSIEVVADGSNKPIQAYENTENKCGSQFVGVYTSTFSVFNAIAFLSAVGLAHW